MKTQTIYRVVYENGHNEKCTLEEAEVWRNHFSPSSQIVPIEIEIEITDNEPQH